MIILRVTFSNIDFEWNVGGGEAGGYSRSPSIVVGTSTNGPYFNAFATVYYDSGWAVVVA